MFAERSPTACKGAKERKVAPCEWKRVLLMDNGVSYDLLAQSRQSEIMLPCAASVPIKAAADVKIKEIRGTNNESSI